MTSRATVFKLLDEAHWLMFCERLDLGAGHGVADTEDKLLLATAIAHLITWLRCYRVVSWSGLGLVFGSIVFVVISVLLEDDFQAVLAVVVAAIVNVAFAFVTIIRLMRRNRVMNLVWSIKDAMYGITEVCAA